MTGLTFRVRTPASRIALMLAGVFALLVLGMPAVAHGDGVVSVPDVPDTPTGTALHIGIVDVEWNDVDGADSYEVQVYLEQDWTDLPGDGMTIVFYGAGAVVRNLPDWGRYYFRVRARNATGVSDWSGFNSMPTTGGANFWVGVPELTNSAGTGTPAIGGRLRLGETLTAETSGISDANGLERVKFSYQWLSGDGVTDTTIEGATDARYTLGPADEGRFIKVRVSYNDRHGFAESLTGVATGTVGPPSTVPDQPLNLRITRSDNGELELAWEPPASDGGRDLTGYKLQWKSGEQEYDPSRQAKVSGLSHTLATLENGVEYTVRVIAVNNLGDGEASEVTGTQTDTVPPGLLGAEVNGSSTTLTYDEALDESSVPDKSVYTVTVDGVTRLVSQVSVAGSRVTLTLADPVSFGEAVTVDYTIPTDASKARVLDTGGNPAPPLSGEVATNATNSPATGAPTISGRLRVGWTLTADTSGMADANGLDLGKIHIQWTAAGLDIGGATTSTYTLVSADEGKVMAVRVSFTDLGGYPETVTSAATGAVGPPLTVPGTPQDLNIPRAENGELELVWAPPASDGGEDVTGYRVQWKSGTESYDASRQTEVSGLSHRIEDLTDGVEYTLRVAAVNQLGAGGFAEITGTPVDTIPPDLVGVEADGPTVTLTYDGALDGDSVPQADAFAVTVAGVAHQVSNVSVDESHVTLTLTEAVVFGDAVTVEYTAPSDVTKTRVLDAVGNPIASFSGEQATNVTDSPATGAPIITGRLAKDGRVRADTSSIADENGLVGVRFEYQWASSSDGNTYEDISGATKVRYKLTAADVGRTIKVRVSFTDNGGNDETLTSAATTEIAAWLNTEPTGRPEITGNPKVGRTLNANTSQIDDFDGLDSATFSYQWISSDGSDDAELPGATSSNYVLSGDDEGKSLSVRVSFTDDAGTHESLTSATTSLIRAEHASTTSNGRILYLTFDDGPHRVYTPQVLDLLASYDVRAMFFVTGKGVVRHPDIIDRIAAEGHALGNHTWAHERLPDLSEGEFIKTVTRAQDALGEYATPCLRPPYGAINSAGRRLAETLGFEVVMWSVDSQDWRGPGVDWILSIVRPNVRNGSVVLFHDAGGHGQTVVALNRLLEEWTDQGYRFGPVCQPPELVAEDLPTISGRAQVGRVLTTHTDGIPGVDGLSSADFSYQWLRNDDGDEAEIPGATSTRYTLIEDDEGKTLRVRVTFTDDKHTEQSLTSATTRVVLPVRGPLSKFVLVDASDQTTLATLSDGDEVVLDDPAQGSYALRVDVRIRTYIGSVLLELTGDRDVSHTEDTWPHSLFGKNGRGTLIGEALPEGPYTLRATAYSEEGGVGDVLGTLQVSFTVTSLNTPATGLPTISGTARVGETLTATTTAIADADGMSDPFFSYQWMSDDTDMESATSSAHRVSTGDVGKAIKVRVSFRDDAGNEETRTSAPTATVAATVPGPPRNLEVSASDAGALDLSWDEPDSDGGSDITGYKAQYREMGGTWNDPAAVSEETATGTVHTVSGLTGGVEYTLRVMAINGVGVGPPSAEISATAQEMIAWTATLTVGTGDGKSGYTYFAQPAIGSLSETRFELDGSNNIVYFILIMDGDLNFGLSRRPGHSFTLRVGDEEFASEDATASRNDGADSSSAIYWFRWEDPDLDWEEDDEVAVSLVLGKAGPTENTPAMGRPTITGTARVGQTLAVDTTSISDADGMDGVLLKHQWLRDGSRIFQATDSRYTVREVDRGSAISVEVSFLDNAYFIETLASDATAAVPAHPPPPPSNLAVALVDGYVTLTWDAPTEDSESVTAYQVLRRRPGIDEIGDFGMVATTTADFEGASATSTTYVDTTADQPGGAYTYRVKAWQGTLLSSWSRYARIDLPADYAPPEPKTQVATSTEKSLAATSTREDITRVLGLSQLTALLRDGSVTMGWETSSGDTGSAAEYEVARDVVHQALWATGDAIRGLPGGELGRGCAGTSGPRLRESTLRLTRMAADRRPTSCPCSG